MQATGTIMLIRPACFGFNAETAASNSFQQVADVDAKVIARKALDEFDNFVAVLQANGVGVIIFEDSADPLKPDAIFPNNWISLHSDGTIVLYPMQAANRRIERRRDIVDAFEEQFHISRIIDLSDYESEGKFLEGTGSIVFDHDHKVAYAVLSPRTDHDLFVELCTRIGYTPVCFHACNEQGQAIYHTNVVMCIAQHCCIICLDSIKNPDEKQLVGNSLASTGRDIVEISHHQMNNFAGNMLAVINNKGEQLIVLSQRAHDSLTEDQKKRIAKHARLLPIAIPTIETIGGGSARCMMAEVFLPKQ